MLGDFCKFNSHLLNVLDAHFQLEHLVQASSYAHSLTGSDGLEQVSMTLVSLCESEMFRVLAGMEEDLRHLRDLLRISNQESASIPLPPPVNGSIA
jgi:hypothetical protein